MRTNQTPLPSAALALTVSGALLSILIGIDAFVLRSTVPRDFFSFFPVLALGTFTVGAATWRERDFAYRTRLPFKSAEIIGILLVSLAAAYFRLRDLASAQLWLNEFSQATLSLLDADGPVQAAAKQHQPPLGYFLSAWGLRIAGFTELGAKLPSLASGVVLVPILALTAREMFLSRWAGAVAAILCALNPCLIAYSREGRPILPAVLGALVTIAWVHDCARRPRLLPFVCTAFSAWLFCTTVGLQPCILLFSLLLTLGAVALVDRKRRKKLAHAACAILVGLTLFLPLQLVIFRRAPKIVFQPDWRHRLSSPFSYLHWSDFLSLRDVFSVPWIIEGAVLAAIVFLAAAGKERRLRTSLLADLVPLALVTVLFFFSYVWFFEVVIRWNLDPRYLLTGSVSSMLLLSGAFAGLLRGRFIPGRARNTVCIACLAGLVAVQLPGLSEAYWRADSADWRGVYQFFEKPENAGKIAQVVAIPEEGKWSIQGFPGSLFYYRMAPPAPVRLRTDDASSGSEVRWLWRSLHGDVRFASVFLVFIRDRAWDPLAPEGHGSEYLESALPYSKVWRFKGIDVLEVPIARSLSSSLQDSYEAILRRYKDTLGSRPDRSLSIEAYLATLDLAANRVASAARRIDLMKSMPGDAMETRVLRDLEELVREIKIVIPDRVNN